MKEVREQSIQLPEGGEGRGRPRPAEGTAEQRPHVGWAWKCHGQSKREEQCGRTREGGDSTL